MKRILIYRILPLVGFAMPLAGRAAEDAVGPGSFVNSLSLWVAVAAGVLASIIVLVNATKLRGGVFGTVLLTFGVGMLLVVFGFFVVVIPPWASLPVIMRTHDLAFIIGYVLMAIGGQRLLRAIQPHPAKPPQK